MTLCKKNCKKTKILCQWKYSATVSEVKMDAEAKKSGLGLWKWTERLVWRHQLGIWANLGKLIKFAIMVIYNQ